MLDLAALFKTKDGSFLQHFRDVRYPGRLDRDGFRDVPSHLALTKTIEPYDKGERRHRLSDRALARVLLDVRSTLQVPSRWAQDITEGP
ncbi:hypothetical protein PHMEG_00026672 [Phytophthora megakarya]|uniref:Uncharacterized protein n=1 Tax=Phytophthora megakarya TaxID=4795 RepID=A0A225VA85_9STRA|nr:hypothetical protein PHMEG_00026672 [Phytophthora megakarya]